MDSLKKMATILGQSRRIAGFGRKKRMAMAKTWSGFDNSSSKF
jgi:hypothetical protein